jgi:hypothetical protein
MIIVNGIRTPDGTEIFSKNRHDFVVYKDNNGKEYGVDGGRDYLKRMGNIKDCVELSLDFDSDFKLIRQRFVWGKLLKNNKTKWIKLKDLDDDHLDVLFDYSKLDWQKILWIKEKLYRAEQEYE